MIPLPTELLVCRWGKSTSITGQPIVVDDRTAATWDAWIAQHGCDEIPLDFEHNSFVADSQQAAGKPQDPVRIAAYGSPVLVPGRGIVLRPDPDKWTDEGRDYYQGKHYCDISPVLSFGEDGQTVVGITSVALCRRGAIPGLTAFNAQLANPDTNMDTSSTETTTATPADTAPEEQMTALKSVLVELLKKLGVEVADDASLEEVMAAANAWKKEDKPEDKPADKTDAPQAFSANSELGKAFTALSAKVDGLVGDREKSEKELMIEKAKLAGKEILIPAGQLMAFSAPQLKVYLDSLKPGAVPFSAPAQSAATGAKPSLTESQRAIAKSMGLSDDEYLRGIK